MPRPLTPPRTPMQVLAREFDTIAKLPEPQQDAYWRLPSAEAQDAYLAGVRAADEAHQAAAEKPAAEPVTPSRPVRL